mmetsp:Transcript_15256/g.23744  ORF Transcript_15256/g.23744 Transcript_15256/m.23744 type:complete len:686 (+) Transcript_15256:99-2156(+)|eukprot:CAMPEP_0195288970 /NCGR_PEP_ID=MMETSP0707-20130614/5431_1 /TAXON_ID=33640 /ORGANISM="Asterionellopsis glacialis, Strain CCMP134" /LENGTH=685 /DNA_ID=CAMNT_0040348919 /DNA_START=20 /DNA_END=2077 /DNA_ORIENTATION=-
MVRFSFAFAALAATSAALLSVPNVHGFTTPSPESFQRVRQTSTTTKHSLRMVANPIESSSSTEAPSVKNRVSKYPTARGSEVDSRKIVSTPLKAIRLSHILFASQDLADQSLARVRSASISFDDLALQISNCAETRDHGGSIGWVSVVSTSEEVDKNEHLDPILPLEARNEVLSMSSKPGDIVSVESSRGYHLVQILDVMVDVRKMAQLKMKNRARFTDKEDGPTGILGGALSMDEADRPKVLTYKVETMGCQMNIADSERMEGQLQNLGIRPLSEEEEDNKKIKPDLILLNTCSIRDHAEQKVYSYIGPHAKRKREGEDVTIVVAGCVAQQEGEALLRRAPEVDLVMGPQYANRIADLLEDVSNGNQVVATEASHIMEDSTKPRRTSTVAAWVNVIYGCNERCTYCIVPTTRGVEQSRPPQSIMDEVEELVAQGYKEVTLLGQNIDAYGRDMSPKRKFSDLLRSVGSVPGLDRLRFVTSHPRYMSLGVVDAVAETPAACESFHVPFQSGSNAVLAAMGRGHTREKFLQIVDRIRSRLPDASITADVIVGFPGETDEDFEDTLSLMEEVVFDSVNTAAYSPRPNTPAAEWTNQLSEDVKMTRLRRINEMNLKHAAQRRARMQDRTVEVLVEERNVKVPTQVMGRTTQGYIVYCEGDINELKGELIHVKIEECQTYYLKGTRVDMP